MEEQKKAEEKEEEEQRRRAAKEEEEKKKREEKEERQSRRKGQGKFPGLSVSRFVKNINISINFSHLARSQILRRHTTYDKGKSVHIHSWHRNQVLYYLCSLSSVSPSSPS